MHSIRMYLGLASLMFDVEINFKVKENGDYQYTI